MILVSVALAWHTSPSWQTPLPWSAVPFFKTKEPGLFEMR